MYLSALFFDALVRWRGVCASSLMGCVIILSMPACSVDTKINQDQELTSSNQSRVDEPERSVEIIEASHNPATLASTEIPSAEPPAVIILQDGVDAFLGYRTVPVPEDLSVIYADQQAGIVAFINGFNLREMANQEGVSAWAKIRTSKAGETTWQYELSYLPDDAVYARDYKIYLKRVDGGVQIAKIGQRIKCYRGDTPKKWTVSLCP